ncbi:hypothetical protein V496_02562 [Pseudogymnoascus sp. VKM F-4515 (FW-2607)]|nr:hypothetical protein V496_02562 [Pseudogymnoascus sp. VKM F-4515 (FW-2607)]
MNSIDTTTITSGDRKPSLFKDLVTRETTVTDGTTFVSIRTVDNVGDLGTLSPNKGLSLLNATQLALLNQPIRCGPYAPTQICNKTTGSIPSSRWSFLDKAVEWAWENDGVSPASQSGNSTVRAAPADAVDVSDPVLCQSQSGSSTGSSASTTISPGLTTYGPTITTIASQPDNPTALDKYEIIYLCTGENFCSAAELCSSLGPYALFKMHDVIAMLPVEDNIWEVLMPARHIETFSRRLQ